MPDMPFPFPDPSPPDHTEQPRYRPKSVDLSVPIGNGGLPAHPDPKYRGYVPGAQDSLVTVGTRAKGDPLQAGATELFWDGPGIAAHAGTPWMADHLRQRHGISAPAPEPSGGAVQVPMSMLARNSLVVGAAGSGKTRLALHLLREHLRAGGSAVVMDRKSETVRQALAAASQAGLPASAVTLLLPSEAASGMPGWNPFAGPPNEKRQAVRELKAILRASASGWGDRMDDLLTNAATVVAAQGLSLVEMVRFLQSEPYRDALLAKARAGAEWAEFRVEHEYFAGEFKSVSKTESPGAVLNKVRGLVALPFLRALLCARTDTLDLPGLWHSRRLVAVHMDEYALGEDGAAMLSGMLAHSLFAAASRGSGPVPVLLFLDELSRQEKFLGGAVSNILAMARGHNLRVLAATQSLGQLSDRLRNEALTNTAFRAFFRLSSDDAREAARSLSPPGGSALKAAVSADPSGDLVTESYPVVRLNGRPFEYDPGAWRAWEESQSVPYWDQRHRTVRQVARAVSDARHGMLAKMPDGTMRDLRSGKDPDPPAHSPERLTLSGNQIWLSVTFPKAAVKVLSRSSDADMADAVAKALQSLPVQEALVRTDTGLAARVRVVDATFPSPLPEFSAYLGNGQTAQEVAATEAARYADMDALPAGAPPPPATPTQAPKAARPPYAATDAKPLARKTGQEKMDEFAKQVMENTVPPPGEDDGL